MSFAKSKTKRFNDVISCAPPPGAYDPKVLDKVPGVYIVKEKRFKDPLANDSDASMCSISSYGSLETLTPRKVIFNTPHKKDVRSIKKPSLDSLRQRELERELKQVVHERSTLERTIQCKDEELKKLEVRVHQLQKDKLALESNVATLKKEVASLQKSNDSLKQNVNEDIRKAVADAKRPLLEKLEKLMAQQTDKESLLQATVAELQQNKTKLSDLQQAYDELQQTVEEKVNTAVKDVREQLLAEQAKIKEYYKEQEHCLKSILEHLEEKMKSTEECNQSLEKYRDSLVREIDGLKETILQMGVQKFDDDNFIRHLKGEVFAMKDAAVRKEEELEEANKKISDLEYKILKLSEIKASQKDDLEKMEIESCKLKQKIVAVETEAKKSEEMLKKDISEIQKKLDDCQTENNSLNETNNELSQCLKRHQEMREYFDGRIKELEQNHSELVLKLKDTEAQLSDAQLQNIQLENELQSFNWDKGCLEGKLGDMQNICEQLEIDKDNLISYYEDRLKDVQGQIVMMRDIVDNKQYEINDLLNNRALLERNLEQLQNDLLFEKQTNRTREFLLQEQEKENWRELERTQRAEKEMRAELDSANKEKRALAQELEDIKQQLESLKGSHQQEINELQERLQQVSSSCPKLSEMEKTLEEKDQLLDEKEKRIHELEKLVEEKDENLKSLPGWKEKYEILHERILPFEEQLEAYEAEKQALLGISQNAQQEVEKLNKEYAKLLGHQNHKQKIRYVEKMKMENSSLKTELTKLRELIARQKRQISKLESQVPKVQYSRTKENLLPLREGNHHLASTDPKTFSGACKG